MWALYKKELGNFFASLTGYLTIAVFLILTGLMLWVLNSDFNILDYGYAGMDGMFLIGPFLYLFLIPAITMRTFSEEKRTGTLELLLTRGLSDWTIVWSKFLAAWTLVFISLLPTLVCYFSVVALGDPVGNIDTGSVMGSYIGLLLLGGAFVAIGLFSSSLTNNQIISFIVSAVLCAVIYLGFESIYHMGLFGSADLVVKRIGIMHHYESISRGVVDTRDVIYFVSVAALFLLATRMVLQSRLWNGWQKRKNLKRSHWIELGVAVAIILSVNIIGKYLYGRIDLTSERRYTLSKSTKELLKKIDEPVLYRVYLEKLAGKGIQPTQIQVKSDGGVTTQVLIPAADVIYRGRETTVQLLQNQKYVSESDLLNNSIQNLEYSLSSAIRALAKGRKQSIGFLQGQGELNGGVLYDFQRSLEEFYSLEYVEIDGQIQSLTAHRKREKDSTYSIFNLYDLLIVAKPTQHFTDKDLFILDQYIMYGGKVLWLVDPLDADIDSLAERGMMMSTRLPLGLDEMLFTYGVRVNPNLLMDIRCRPIPMQVGMVGEKPQFRFVPWYYFPDIVPLSEHPIVRNLDIIKTDFVSSIDLIDNDIQKTVLLTTSEYTRVKNAPATVDLADAQAEPDRRMYNKSSLPVAVLLEGEFKSAWRNRLSPELTEQTAIGYKDISKPTKMIVISDGDIIRNRFNAEEGIAYPLGYDNYTQTFYANKDFLLNAVNYLVGDEGLMESRTRNIKLRKLDVMKVKEQRGRYQVINLVLPLALLAAAGGIIAYTRRKRYTK